MNLVNKLFSKQNDHDQEDGELCPNSVYQTYETLCLNQPQLNIKGVWKLDNYYYIVCPGLRKGQSAMNGDDFEYWFSRHHIIGSPTKISAFIPPGAKRVKLLNQSHLAKLAGVSRTLTDFYYDLLINLPKEFPGFKLRDEEGCVTVLTEQPLTRDQVDQLNLVVRQFNEHLKLAFAVYPNLNEYEQPVLKEVMLLTPSRSLFRQNIPLKQIWEEDEDFWTTNKHRLLDANANRNTFLEKDWLSSGCSCMVAEYVQPHNLRNYLTLYNTVYLRLPILEHHFKYMKALGCTTEELVQLCNLGKVKLVLDQPIHRYYPEIYSILTSINKSSYILTRRLAAVTAADLRRRFPFLFPILDIETKYQFLHSIQKVLDKSEFKEQAGFIQMIALMWGNYFQAIERWGTHGLTRFGVYHIFDFLFTQKEKDFGVELLDTSPGVTYAAAFGANLISRNTYDDTVLATLMANMYSGLPKNFVRGNQHLANTAVDNILVINNEVPVVELATSFRSGDIDRFRNLIYGLTKHTKNEEELKSAIQNFNNEVKRYANHKEIRDGVDIRGFIVDGASAVSNVSVPFSGWFVERMLTILGGLSARNRTLRKMEEYLASFVGDTIPDAVLVARMRDQLSKCWQKSKFGY